MGKTSTTSSVKLRSACLISDLILVFLCTIIYHNLTFQIYSLTAHTRVTGLSLKNIHNTKLHIATLKTLPQPLKHHLSGELFAPPLYIPQNHVVCLIKHFCSNSTGLFFNRYLKKFISGPISVNM